MPHGHLDNSLIGKEFTKRGQIDTRRQRIDHHDFVRAGKLHQAQFRPVGAFAHEFRVDGDEGFAT